jgi:uncharacterized protein DUF6471
LAEKLKKHGFKETKASIANELAQATMSADFFRQWLQWAARKLA